MTRNSRRQVVAWIALPAVAVANGVVRDTTYGRVMSRDLSHSVAVVPLCVAIIAWARFLARRWPVSGPKVAVKVGLIWLALTLVFEFGFGAANGTPVREMLAEYDVLRGRLWAIVPIVTGTAPWIAAVAERSHPAGRASVGSVSGGAT